MKEQLCWSCQKVCSKDMCSWMREHKLPEGAQTDAEDFIVACPQFQAHTRIRVKGLPAKCMEFFGISHGTYYRNKDLWQDRYFREHEGEKS